jgi:hypothetical protein
MGLMGYPRFVGLDILEERISIAVAESGRSGAVEYLGKIIMNLALSASCATVCGAQASHCRFVMRPLRAAMAFKTTKFPYRSPLATASFRYRWFSHGLVDYCACAAGSRLSAIVLKTP